MFGEALLERWLAEGVGEPAILLVLALGGLLVSLFVLVTRSRRKLLLDLEIAERLLDLRDARPDDVRGRTLDPEAALRAAEATFQWTYSWPALTTYLLRLCSVVLVIYAAYAGFLTVRMASWAPVLLTVVLSALGLICVVAGVAMWRHAGRPENKEADARVLEVVNRRVLEGSEEPAPEA